MPLLSASARRVGTTAGVGTQVVLGTLTITAGFIIEFDPSVFTTAGTYALFTYGTLVGTAASLVPDDASLRLCGFSRAVFSSTASTNGTLYVTLS